MRTRAKVIIVMVLGIMVLSMMGGAVGEVQAEVEKGEIWLKPKEVALVSVTSEGGQTDKGSDLSVISDDGRYVVFTSNASNLVAGDENKFSDVFLKDLQENQIINLTLGGNGSSYAGDISGDGRYIVIHSEARNLVGGDENGRTDIFLIDRETGSRELISKATSGIQSNQSSNFPKVSDDGVLVQRKMEEKGI